MMDTVRGSYLRSLSASSVGALFECYDFMLCAFLAPTLIHVFFSDNAFWGIFSIFSIAFFSRPLGGIFWGYLGDKYGRKKAFSLSMILLSIPTLLIAFFPIQLFSLEITSFLFAILRFAQGFFVGGEFPGGVVFVAESSHTSSRGFSIAIFMSALTGGTLLASLSSLLLNLYFNTEQINNFAWRLPFLFGLILVFIAIYIRNKIHETPFFTAMMIKKTSYSNPLSQLIKQYKYELWQGLMIVSCSACGLTTLYVFFPQMMSKSFLTREEILLLTTSGSIILCILMPFIGWLSDRVDRKSIFIIGLTSLVGGWSIIILGYFELSFQIILIGMIVSSLSFSLINGVYCVMLSELFATNVRYSGVAFCYSVAYSLCGGFLPLLYNYGTTQLIKMCIPIGVFFLLIVIILRLKIFVITEEIDFQYK